MPFDEGDEKRDKIRDFLQEQAFMEEDDPSAVLTGWVVICEWTGSDGPYLSFGHDSATPRWKAEGMLHEGLYRWPDETP